MKYKIYLSWVYTPEWTPHNWDEEEYIVEDLEEGLAELIDRMVHLRIINNAKISEIKIKEII